MPKGAVYVPKLSDSKLRDLTWSLDINETIYSKDSKGLISRGEADGDIPAFTGLPENIADKLPKRQNIYQ